MIYLDNNATTHALPEVIQTVRDTMERFTGNPSSAHALGTDARKALESARQAIADGFGAGDASRIIFTSCGTESINTAFSLLSIDRVTQIVVSSVEHAAVFRAAGRWGGARKICRVPVSSDGALDMDTLARLVAEAPSLVSLCLANNETGILTDIPAAAALCRRSHALLHVDAVQAAGKIPVNLARLDCDAASLSAHKFHGPPGCGILFLRTPSLNQLGGQPLLPGHQEHGLRAGTQNLPAILGTAVAVGALHGNGSGAPYMSSLRDGLESRLLSAIPGSEVHGTRALRLPNTTSLYCPNRNAADLVANLSQMGVIASAGAACSTGGAPSPTIQAMGFSSARANSTLRFSLSRFTTLDEINEAARIISKIYNSTLATTTPCI
jgi:cysteine desulfurase